MPGGSSVLKTLSAKQLPTPLPVVADVRAQERPRVRIAPFFITVLLTTRFSSGGPKPNGLSTMPIPKESLWVITLRRIDVVATDVQHPASRGEEPVVEERRCGWKGLGRLLALDHISLDHRVLGGRRGESRRATTRMPVTLLVSLLPLTNEFVVFSSSIPITPLVSLLFVTVMLSSTPT